MAEWQKVIDNKLDLKKVNDIDDFLSSTQNIGSIETAITNNMYGLNHESVKGVVPDNKDQTGYVFFVRPQLNLRESNVANAPDLSSYLNTDSKSIHMYARNMLDPRLHLQSNGAISSVLMDHQLAFIPILTNNLETLSGWPDTAMGTYTSTAGVRKQEWSIIDSNCEIANTFDLDLNFRNTYKEPIFMLFKLWVKYAGYTYENLMSKYLDYIVANRIDYNTRVYRLVMDPTKRFVEKIGIAGVAFPYVLGEGSYMDFNASEVYNTQNKDIRIRLKATVAEYNRDIIIHEFNKTVGIFNSNIRDLIKSGSSGSLVKIPYELKPILNNRGYPYINTKTGELEWYIDKNSRAYRNAVTLYGNK